MQDKGIVRGLPVDGERLVAVLLAVVPAYEWHQGVSGKRERNLEQSRDEATGYLLWDVKCSLIYRSEAETVVVTVPSREEPDYPVRTGIVFDDMAVEMWPARNGGLGGRFTASGMREADSVAALK